MFQRCEEKIFLCDCDPGCERCELSEQCLLTLGHMGTHTVHFETDDGKLVTVVWERKLASRIA